MHDTYIQSEKEWEESNLCYCDKCKKFSFEKRKDTLIAQFQTYVKELEGEWMEFDPEKMEGIFHDPSAVQGYSTGLQLAIDKANNFIKYLEQR